MEDESQFIPEQSSLLQEPMRCPHCGNPLPQEPGLLEPDDRRPVMSFPNDPQVRYDHENQRVEVFGGESDYSEADPLTIEAERLGTVRDLTQWMARIAAEPWAHGEEFFVELGDALIVALSERALAK